MSLVMCLFFFFFFNDTATTEIYTSVHTLSLHDALPIGSPSRRPVAWCPSRSSERATRSEEHTSELQSRTLNSYAVFCLKKKKKKKHKNKISFIIVKKKKKKKKKNH